MTFERLGTMNVNAEGHLEIGGVDTLKLTEKYGTPLYVYDVALIRDRARGFKKTFEELGVKAQVAYASKAFSAVAIYQLMAEEGLSLDVVSGGELYTAIKANFPPERIHFHGNNKSAEEIHMALDYGIGCFVIDNYYEISLLEDILIERNEKASVLIRVTPGIEAHTHDYILTGQDDSKFGFGLTNGQAEKAIKQVLHASASFDLIGLHCHIGSQIFETTGFKLAARRIMDKLVEWHQTLGFDSKVLNLGGGFGVRYTAEDEPLEPSEYVRQIMDEVRDVANNNDIDIPEIWIGKVVPLLVKQEQHFIKLDRVKKFREFGIISQLTAACLIISVQRYMMRITMLFLRQTQRKSQKKQWLSQENAVSLVIC